MPDIAEPRPISAARPLIAAAATIALAAAVSFLLPDDYAATGVGFVFLGATYFLVLRQNDSERIRQSGLELGGLFSPEPLSARRMVRDTLRALGPSLLLSLLLFPAFWLGYRFYNQPALPFTPRLPQNPIDASLGQLLVIALPEEAFFRGYLQTELDKVWPPRFRLLGAALGPSLLLTSLVFALAHVVTEPYVERLAVFFPALVFGWLRARTSGIGAPTLFHASCNLFASFLGRGYGLGA